MKRMLSTSFRQSEIKINYPSFEWGLFQNLYFAVSKKFLRENRFFQISIQRIECIYLHSWCIRLFRSRSLTSSFSFEGDSFLQAATHTRARVAHYPRRIIFNDAVEFYDFPPRFTGRWVYVREGSFNDRGWILAVVPVINDCTYEVSFSLGNWKEVRCWCGRRFVECNWQGWDF